MPSDPQSSAPFRVARIITRLNIGGPSIQATRLTAELETHGFHTRLMHGRLGEGEGDMSYLLPPAADVVSIPTLGRPISPIADGRALVRIYRELKRLRPAIVHTHMAKAGMLGRLAAAAYNLARGQAPRARVVHTYHGHVLEGYFGPLMTRAVIMLERLLARGNDAIIAISPAIAGELRDGFGIGRADQYHLVPLGFDLSPFAAIDAAARARARAELGVPPDATVVCTVGRLTAIKEHRLFLDVVARVAANRPHLVALVVGDGELRADLEAYTAQRRIADRVRFLGWRRDLATIYGATDVFLLTSRNEGTPVALIEAMASGVPGVSTDVGGVKDVIPTPALGRLAASGDTAGLVAAVDDLLADAGLRQAMGARAREHVVQHFGIERLVREIATLYRDLLDRP